MFCFVFHFSPQVSLSVSSFQISMLLIYNNFYEGKIHFWQFQNLYHSFKAIHEKAYWNIFVFFQEKLAQTCPIWSLPSSVKCSSILPDAQAKNLRVTPTSFPIPVPSTNDGQSVLDVPLKSIPSLASGHDLDHHHPGPGHHPLLPDLLQ